MMTEEQQKKVCAAARALVGVRWRGQGRDLMGVDCTGLVSLSFQNAGMPLAEPTPDYRGVDSKRLMQMLVAHCDRVALKDAKPADIVLYGQNVDTHIALLVDGNPLNLIHCPIHRGVVEARFDSSRGPIRGVFRCRGW